MTIQVALTGKQPAVCPCGYSFGEIHFSGKGQARWNVLFVPGLPGAPIFSLKTSCPTCGKNWFFEGKQPKALLDTEYMTGDGRAVTLGDS